MKQLKLEDNDYAEFGEIIKTMEAENYDYRVEGFNYKLNALNERRNGKIFSMSEHVKGMIFSILSNNRPWKVIEDNRVNINNLFHNFDIDYIKTTDPQIFIHGLKSLSCGNRRIKFQMNSLRYNIEILERIENDYGSVDNYYNKTDKKVLVRSLSKKNAKYKLKEMGHPLASEYLKNVGIDVVKADVHICRILNRLGYTKSKHFEDIFDICDEIANKYKMTNIEVDTILWQFCAKDYVEICCKQPKCERCLVENCPSRIN